MSDSTKLTKTTGAPGERVRMEVEFFDLEGTQRITGRIVFDDPGNTPVLEFTAYDGDVERLTHGLRNLTAMLDKAVPA